MLVWGFPDHGGYLCNSICTYVVSEVVARNIILCKNIL
ncbi:hypothetical protein ECH7EC869_4610 [Escherichia coli O157:H7 str. EC869]|uniref:Uncharacterized protein n=1 Tax=Escherichia coli O157:H7 (strain EC869) TaxID=478008 RepID=A0A0H3PR46_ECO5C|nr:hypothetical protein ECH7EC869_4610 [Escherichia coli O157:H7 str. EC869]